MNRRWATAVLSGITPRLRAYVHATLMPRFSTVASSLENLQTAMASRLLMCEHAPVNPKPGPGTAFERVPWRAGHMKEPADWTAAEHQKDRESWMQN